MASVPPLLIVVEGVRPLVRIADGLFGPLPLLFGPLTACRGGGTRGVRVGREGGHGRMVMVRVCIVGGCISEQPGAAAIGATRHGQTYN